MSTLLLRFAGPLQSWGSSSRFTIRMTEREPTKSGTIGLIAAAMGRMRDDSIEDLTGVKFGVRIDQVGKLLSDFHTAKSASGESFVSRRYYLADAIFLVGIEGAEELLIAADKAINNPVFPLYLGRRSCPPVGPVSLGIQKGLGLAETLTDLNAAPWQASDWYQKKQGEVVYLELVMDADPEEKGAFLKSDVPITFDQSYRRYGYRNVVSKNKGVKVENPLGKGGHDPMEVL